MDGNRRFERFFRWARPRHDPREVDAADMGTAFGMELTLDASQRAASDTDAEEPEVRERTGASPTDRSD